MKNILFTPTLAIRIPSFLSNQITTETAKRDFFKKDGKGNENEFLNQILPNIIQYRTKKRDFLHARLDKQIKDSISKPMQEKILNFIVETCDLCYFGEYDYNNEETLNIRFDVKNEEFYANLFVQLENSNIKKSSYIRSLLHEYCALPEYKKERVCFLHEYETLNQACQDNTAVRFQYEDKIIKATALSLEYSFTREKWYFIYMADGESSKLYSTPLYLIKKPLHLLEKSTEPPSAYAAYIHSIIQKGIFADQNCFILGDTKDAAIPLS